MAVIAAMVGMEVMRRHPGAPITTRNK